MSRFLRRSLMAVLALLLFLSGLQQHVVAQPGLTYDKYEVVITLAPDGDFHVTTTQNLSFDGAFSTAFFEIPVGAVTGVENIDVRTSSGADSTDLSATENLTVTEFDDVILVEWTYPTTRPGDRRAFQIDYDVVGGTWVYPKGDFLSWNAIRADRGGIDVQESSVTVNLPALLPADQVTANSNVTDLDLSKTENQVRLQTGKPLPDGVPFDVALSWPHGLLPVEVQTWQRQEDLANLGFQIDSLHADLALDTDGSLHVHEQLSLSVLTGHFYDGIRPLPLLYFDSVSDVSVGLDDRGLDQENDPCTECFTIAERPRDPSWVVYSNETDNVEINASHAGQADIVWSIEGIGPGKQALFDIRYTIQGAIQVGQDEQTLTWDLIPKYELPVEKITARIQLPPGVDSSTVSLDSSAPITQSESSRADAFDLEYAGEIQPRARWQISLLMPADATAAEKPEWQRDMESLIVQEESTGGTASADPLRLTAAAVLLLALVGLALFWLWPRLKRSQGR